ncbi:MAG: hypothetical protein CNLJKLNK_00951 [Holosporales bacterium]
MIGFYFYKHINKNDFLMLLQKMTLLDIFLALITLWSAMFLTAYRWHIILKASLNLNFPVLDSFTPVMRGYVLSQVLPSSIGGDAYKIYFVQKFRSVFESVLTVLTDRLWGLLICFVLGGTFLPFYATTLYQTMIGKMVIIAFLLFVLFIGGALIVKNFLVLRWPLVKKITNTIDKTFDPPYCSKIFLVSFVIALLLAATVYVLSNGMHLNVPYGVCCIIMPLIFLATALPISFSGWGVREGMFALLLSMIGVTMEEAVALSLLYGMMLLISTIPLSVFFIRKSA